MLYSFLREDRLEEGAKDRYRAMFAFLNIDLTDPVMKEYAGTYAGINRELDSALTFATTSLNPPAMAWWLRWFRVWAVAQLMRGIQDVMGGGTDGNYQFSIPPDDPRGPTIRKGMDMYDKYDSLYKKYFMDLCVKVPAMAQYKNPKTALMICRDAISHTERRKFKHFYDLVHIPGTRQYSPEGKLPNMAAQEMKKIEDEYKKEHEGLIHPDKHEGELIVGFPDGSGWFDLGVSGCPIEAAAMGHCGNGVGSSDETVLSYRVPVQKGPKTYWSPHMTFILNTDTGRLGEMKGRGNDKPVAKYHSRIIALLKSPMIKGIRGGGYLPENNFALSDLPEDVCNQLLDEKPELGGPSIWLRRYRMEPEKVTEEMRLIIQNAMVEAGLSIAWAKKSKQVVPFWVPEENMWAFYGDVSGEELVDDLFPSDNNSRRGGRRDKSLVSRLVSNELDFIDAGDHHQPDDHERKKIWSKLDDDDKKTIREYIKNSELDNYKEFVKSENNDEDMDEDTIDPTTEDDDMIINFINDNTYDDSAIRNAFERIASDAVRYGTESEAHKDLEKFLNDPSKQYNLRVKPWLEPACILADTNSMIELLDTLSILEDENIQAWMNLESDMEEPHYGWAGYDLDTAMENASDAIHDFCN